MKKAICILLAMLLVAGAVGGALADGAPAIDYATGTPWLCSDLDGVVTEDTPTNLKDDFALYVNKDAILQLEYKEGYPAAGPIVDVMIQQAEDVKNMFLGDAPQGHDALLAYNLFQLMMDWDSRNALGVSPLKEMIDPVEAIDTLDALTAYYREVPIAEQAQMPFIAIPRIDFADSSRKVLAVRSNSLLLNDSAEYGKLSDYGAVQKAASTELAARMLVKLGYSKEEAQRKIENCFEFETLLAPVIYTNEEQKNPNYYNRIYNIYTRDELAAAQGKLPVLDILERMGYPEQDRYLVENPAFLERVNELYIEENLPLIRDCMIVHCVVDSASKLDRECYEWNNDYDNALSGATGIRDDETAFSAKVADMLEWPVAQLYSETYLKPEDKARITDLVYEILEAYHGILEDADFLSDETRAKAIEKLDAMDVKVLYPDSWEDYNCEGLEIASPQEGGTYWQARNDIGMYKIAQVAKELSEPVNSEKWIMTPQTVNCTNVFSQNSINILGAYAQGAFYNSGMSYEEVLATLGVTIGHEISHGFDSKGAQFDKDGNLSNWWTEADLAEFNARNAKLAAYFDAMHPWEGQDFYGANMTSEACADMVGMKVVLRIAAQREDFDYDAFFRAHAASQLIKYSLQFAYGFIKDEHPMNYLRINSTLQQFDEFLDFYGITEGDGMYLAPEDRVEIW